MISCSGGSPPSCPSLSEVASRLDDPTAPVSIIRLHGPDLTSIEELTGGTWDLIIASPDEVSSAVAEIMRQSPEAEIDAYVNVNTHCEGCAP